MNGNIILLFISQYFIVIQQIALLLIIFLLYLFVFKVKINLNRINIKVYSFAVNVFWVLIYLLLFLITTFSLRILRAYYEQFTDLKILYNYIKLWLSAGLMEKIFWFQIVIFIILLRLAIFGNVRKFLTTHLIALHIFIKGQRYQYRLQNPIYREKKDGIFQLVGYKRKDFFYNNLINKIAFGKLSFRYFAEDIIGGSVLKIAGIFKNRQIQNTAMLFYRNSLSILRYLPLIGLISTITADILINDAILKYTSTYIPFYALYILWYKLSFFLAHSYSEYDQQIYEMCYGAPYVIYHNMGAEEFAPLDKYLSDWLQDYREYTWEGFLAIDGTLESLSIVEKRHRFERVPVNTLYPKQIKDMELEGETWHFKSLEGEYIPYSLGLKAYEMGIVYEDHIYTNLK